MRRLATILLLLAPAIWAVNIKLYLKDGGYHLVSEYKVESDRVKFYSLERSDWEEIPVNLVDLKRTASEASQRQKEFEKNARESDAEEALQRAEEREVRRIPQDPGVYFILDGKTHVIAAGETSVRSNKGRSILKQLAPIPIVSGKSTLELDGPKSKTILTNPEMELFIQLSDRQRFGIAKLTSKGNVRIVENITIMPVTNEYTEEPVMIEIFRKQLTADGMLYKIWPRQALEPGEYAVVEYTEGKLNMQVWDFAIQRAK